MFKYCFKIKTVKYQLLNKNGLFYLLLNASVIGTNTKTFIDINLLNPHKNPRQLHMLLVNSFIPQIFKNLQCAKQCSRHWRHDKRHVKCPVLIKLALQMGKQMINKDDTNMGNRVIPFYRWGLTDGGWHLNPISLTQNAEHLNHYPIEPNRRPDSSQDNVPPYNLSLQQVDRH